MALRPCGKCGEQVDEAKAFCPACGNAMVEERQRATKSDFEKMDSTVQLGQTMYNQMLSDMGLNISAAPNAKKSVTLEPAAAAKPAPVTPAKQSEVPPRKSNRRLWLIAIIVGAALLLLALIVVGAAGVMYYMSRAGGG
jgi:hypothetical protein